MGGVDIDEGKVILMKGIMVVKGGARAVQTRTRQKGVSEKRSAEGHVIGRGDAERTGGRRETVRTLTAVFDTHS